MKTRYTHQQTVARSDGTTATIQHDYVHSAPMLPALCRSYYYAQNGARSLTVRQERQLRKAERRYLAHVMGRKNKSGGKKQKPKRPKGGSK